MVSSREIILILILDPLDIASIESPLTDTGYIFLYQSTMIQRIVTLNISALTTLNTCKYIESLN